MAFALLFAENCGNYPPAALINPGKQVFFPLVRELLFQKAGFNGIL